MTARQLWRVGMFTAVAVLFGAVAASGSLASSRTGAAAHRTAGTYAHGQLIKPFAASQSDNWSGYNQGSLEVHKLFHAITGTWIVPTATQHTAGQAEYAADWIGIGGGCVNSSCSVTDSTLIQTGTEEDVSSTGAASYSAWWELIPAPSVTIKTITVHPGDVMYASISVVDHSTNVWKIVLADLTDKESFTKTVPYSSTHLTAEWIEETPLILGKGAGLAALPNLTSPLFDHATVNGAPANLQPSQEIQLVDSSGNVIADPSSPDASNDGFNDCAWATSCAAPSGS